MIKGQKKTKGKESKEGQADRQKTDSVEERLQDIDGQRERERERERERDRDRDRDRQTDRQTDKQTSRKKINERKKVRRN